MLSCENNYFFIPNPDHRPSFTSGGSNTFRWPYLIVFIFSSSAGVGRSIGSNSGSLRIPAKTCVVVVVGVLSPCAWRPHRGPEHQSLTRGWGPSNNWSASSRQELKEPQQRVKSRKVYYCSNFDDKFITTKLIHWSRHAVWTLRGGRGLWRKN